jgi:uncharacterized protein (TIGR02678 family)
MQELRDAKFDDAAKEAASQLLECFWILRERDPELYQLIREREQVLREYFFDKCGYYLLVHKAFAKLEKIPDIPAPWMGFAELEQTRDYALLCCLLAYLELKGIDEQFLLSDLCEALPALYPDESESMAGAVSWEAYEWRKSLVRVLEFATGMGIINRVDGDLAGFAGSRDNEVLLEVPVVSRYLLRSYPKDLFQFDSAAELQKAEAAEEESALTGKARRHRIYRQLLLTPAFDRNEAREEDFLYLRNMRNRLREDIENHTPFSFELYENMAMLTVSEKKAHIRSFPDQRGISEVVLHLAAFVREQINAGKPYVSSDGTIALTEVQFDRWLAECGGLTGKGWSKEYREMLFPRLKQTVIRELESWKMLRREDETGLLVLLPVIGRTIGSYPKDYKEGEPANVSK